MNLHDKKSGFRNRSPEISSIQRESRENDYILNDEYTSYRSDHPQKIPKEDYKLDEEYSSYRSDPQQNSARKQGNAPLHSQKRPRDEEDILSSKRIKTSLTGYSDAQQFPKPNCGQGDDLRKDKPKQQGRGK